MSSDDINQFIVRGWIVWVVSPSLYCLKDEMCSVSNVETTSDVTWPPADRRTNPESRGLSIFSWSHTPASGKSVLSSSSCSALQSLHFRSASRVRNDTHTHTALTRGEPHSAEQICHCGKSHFSVSPRCMHPHTSCLQIWQSTHKQTHTHTDLRIKEAENSPLLMWKGIDV